MTEDGFIHLVSRCKVARSSVNKSAASVLPPRAQASSGLVLRFREPDAREDDAEGQRKAWMKEHASISKGIPFDVLSWWKEKVSRFPLIAKAAKMVLATPASRGVLRASFQTGQPYWNN